VIHAGRETWPHETFSPGSLIYTPTLDRAMRPIKMPSLPGRALRDQWGRNGIEAYGIHASIYDRATPSSDRYPSHLEKNSCQLNESSSTDVVVCRGLIFWLDDEASSWPLPLPEVDGGVSGTGLVSSV
jgi:hypothetical protein